MTFDFVINNLKNNEAAKTPSMIGYIKREDFELTNEDRENSVTEHYNIEFVGVKPDDRHAFTFKRVSGKSIPEVTGSATLSPALLLNLLSSDWSIHSLEVLESVRANKDTAEW